jgi:hypothetical protein
MPLQMHSLVSAVALVMYHYRCQSQSAQLIEIVLLNGNYKFTWVTHRSLSLHQSTSPLFNFLGLFCGLPLWGLPCLELAVFCGLPLCGLSAFDRGMTGMSFSRVGDGKMAPSSTSNEETYGELWKLYFRRYSIVAYQIQLSGQNDDAWFHVLTDRTNCHRLRYDYQLI